MRSFGAAFFVINIQTSAQSSVCRCAFIFFHGLSSFRLKTTHRLCGGSQNSSFERQPGAERYLFSQRWLAQNNIADLFQWLNNKTGKIGRIIFEPSQLWRFNT